MKSANKLVASMLLAAVLIGFGTILGCNEQAPTPFALSGGRMDPKSVIQALQLEPVPGEGDYYRETHRCKTMDPKSIIQALQLEPLPGEGGYYRETYRSKTEVTVTFEPGGTPVIRQLATAIYYMVTPGEFSALHRLKSDEVFHYYSGDPAELVKINPDGKLETVVLGPNLKKGHQFQALVPAGTWQGTRLMDGGAYTVLGTTVSPAFEFSDFELGKRNELIAQFPDLAKVIERYTRE